MASFLYSKNCAILFSLCDSRLVITGKDNSYDRTFIKYIFPTISNRYVIITNNDVDSIKGKFEIEEELINNAYKDVRTATKDVVVPMVATLFASNPELSMNVTSPYVVIPFGPWLFFGTGPSSRVKIVGVFEWNTTQNKFVWVNDALWK